MKFSPKLSFHSALKSSLIILKLVIPIYILADILFYYNLLEYITFFFEPLTSLLNLPTEAALSIVSGIFLNLYAAIAFAAPLGLTPHEWTILAVFLGICHALIVETAIMKKLGISKVFSISLRLIAGLIVGFITTLLPSSWFDSKIVDTNFPQTPQFDSLSQLLSHSIYESLHLSIQIIILITTLIFILDFIKSLKIVEEYSNKVNSAFSILIGVVLGITYGAGILISEYEKNTLSKKEILYIGIFLMICHAIIEDTLLFVIFGANIWVIVLLRVIFAFIFATICVKALSDKVKN
ncbi:nucleoside recognition domain-containing protein [Sulfurospirillum arcachonense]|uniref:nucleoside recognition domain-containing protein n=1 Tax=Sulfurospirillum arcachonense TaxID=57666 RepID=UPI00046989DB|nr:nucleoside recognition domain-containing protein [Sulfurospirillum arcachonense]